MNSKYMNTAVICENAAPHIYECSACGLDIEDACECPFLADAETIDVYCHVCEATHESISVYDLLGLDDLEFDDDFEDDFEEPEGEPQLFGKKIEEYVFEPKITFSSRCHHYNVPVVMKDGTTIYASSCHDRPLDAPAPDWGLYLDSMWRAAGMAYTVDWPDMSLPKRFDRVAWAIIDVFNKAGEGMWVEVGCIGGHGRTGTALACMAVLGGMKPAEAIEYVRSSYCAKTLETKEQEWFVYWFDCYVNGGMIELIRWDTKTKEQYVAGTYSYPKPFPWRDYDPEANPQGAPPKEIQATVIDRSFSVPYWDKTTKKNRYYTVHHGDKDWEEVLGWFVEQEEKATKEKAAKAAAATKEVEPF